MLVLLDSSVISCSWVYRWMLTNIPHLLMRSSPCFLIAVMLPSICGHESSLQECCSVFVLCENVRLGDGYTYDKHLSRVSLTCFIMRIHRLDIFLLAFVNTPHTLPMIPYDLLLHWWSVSWCIVPWIFAILWYRIVARSLYRDIVTSLVVIGYSKRGIDCGLKYNGFRWG